MNFILRPWKPSDLESLVRHANNPKIAQNMTDGFPHPYTPEKGKAFLEMACQGDPIRLFAIDVNGEAVGGIGIHPQHDIQRMNAELGYWLAEPFWGQGIMAEAVRQVTEKAFELFDINRVFARPFGRNVASQKVLEKAGYVLEARLKNTFIKNGELTDELIYAVRRD